MTGPKPSGMGRALAEAGRGRKKAGGAVSLLQLLSTSPRDIPKDFCLPGGDSEAPATEGGAGLVPACTPQARGGRVLARPSPGCCTAVCHACNA